MILVILVAALALGMMGLSVMYMMNGGAKQPGSFARPSQDQTVDVSRCGDTKSSTLTTTLYNGEDESAGTFDAAGVLEGSSGHHVSITDTTAGTATVNCGETYILKLISADGDQGDNSRIEGIIAAGSIPNAKLVDGGVQFTVDAPNVALNIVGSQHGVLEFRMYSDSNNALMYDSGDATNTDWETDGVTFESTTNNATATAIGSGGEVEITLQFRSTRTTTDFSDFGYWILLDEPTTEYVNPRCDLNGVALMDSKDSTSGGRKFSSSEAIAFSGYEYAYYLDKPVIDSTNKVHCLVKAISGVDASTDVQIDFAAVGQSVANDGVSIQRGANDDDASATTIFAIQDTTLDVS